MMESITNYNNTNQTDLTKGLITIDGDLESEDIKSIKFLCQDDITFKALEKIQDGIQIFNELERIGKIDSTKADTDYLVECLSRCHRMDLVKKLGCDQVQAKNRLELGFSNFSSFRILLFEIAEEMETTDLKPALFSLSTIIPRSKHEKIESVFDLFTLLERSGELAPSKVDVLQKLLKMLDRTDLVNKVKQYQGYVPTGGNTEPGYGPVDEGDVPARVESGMGPVDQGDPVDISDERQTATQRNQYQNSAVNNEGIVDIQRPDRNKNDRQRVQFSEQVKKRLKIEDRASDRVLPGHQTEEQQHSSMQTLPSVIFVGNQISDTVPRTGTSNNLPPHHLVPINDVLEEEQSPGDSGLTAGTISLSDRSSQEMSESSSGELYLSLTERKMICLSEVIAKYEDWVLLREALHVSVETLHTILQSNPTPQLQVHALLKYWFFNQKSGNPNADGLLKALQEIGFTDAIQEYVRISQEPEMESEYGSENFTVASEGQMVSQGENYDVSSDHGIYANVNDSHQLQHMYLRHTFLHFNLEKVNSDGIWIADIYNIGEARILQGELGYMDQQGPSVPVRMTTSSSDAQVGPSLNPLINNQPPNRSEEVIVRQMENVVIDDSIMPFYKMDAKPRGIAIIINNRHFHKVRGDPNSKEMPARIGTEKDAEKLDYIWNKLGFIVKQYDDVNSTRMTQIMVETAFSEDHIRYDCFVCCILTHGVLGHVYGTDGRIVRINQLTSCFSSRRCQALAGKPKMFFIQACQGRDKQEGHAIETDSGVVVEDAENEPERQQDLTVDRPRELIPDEADFLLGYATVPGYVSYRSRSQGSWYINKLSQNLDKYAYQYDLLSILIKVNEEVGRATANIDNGSYKQVPAPMFTLRKRIVFR